MLGIVYALGLVAVASVQVAQPAAASAELPTQLCELHVWPAENNEAISFNIGRLLLGRSTDQQIESAMDDLVSPSAQLTYLRSANMLQELQLPPTTRIVEHDGPRDRASLRRRDRMSGSASSCYSELIVRSNTLIEDIVWGDRFLTTFEFRGFDDGPSYVRRYAGDGGNKLKVLTLSEEARPPNASEVTGEAFRANFAEWAANARRRLAANRTRGR